MNESGMGHQTKNGPCYHSWQLQVREAIAPCHRMCLQTRSLWKNGNANQPSPAHLGIQCGTGLRQLRLQLCHR